MKTPFTILLLVLSLGFAPANMAAQPPNDLIQDAINLAFGPVPFQESVAFSSATNTDDHTPPSGCAVSQAGVWYKFTATQNGIIGAGITLPSNADVIFYEGPASGVTSGSQLTYVNQASNPCASASNLASIQATAGTTYYIYMYNQVDSDVLINAEGIFAPPKNDLIENANSLNSLVQYTENDIHFLMATSTGDDDQTTCPTTDLPGIWYKFTAAANGQVVAGINTPMNESAMVFYSAPDENVTTSADLTYVAQASNPCNPDNLTSINATAGTSYYIFAWQDASPYADVSINLSGIMATEENQLEGFEFYPNPVGDELNLNARSIIDEVNIYNIIGNKVHAKTIGIKQAKLSLGKISSGLYIMEVVSEGITARYKLMKK